MLGYIDIPIAKTGLVLLAGNDELTESGELGQGLEGMKFSNHYFQLSEVISKLRQRVIDVSNADVFDGELRDRCLETLKVFRHVVNVLALPIPHQEKINILDFSVGHRLHCDQDDSGPERWAYLNVVSVRTSKK